MITKMVMPQLSLSMQFGIVNRWFKSEGSYVKQGESICEIEGDKAIIEIDAPVDGYLIKIIAKEMEEFPVREAMAYIADTASETVAMPGEEPPPSIVTDQPEVTAQRSGSIPSTKAFIKASPVAKRMADELGIDLSTVTGTGPDGLIGRNDVLAAKEAMEKKGPTKSSVVMSSSAEAYTDQKLIGIKKIVAERMKKSYTEAPHIELAISVEMQAAAAFRDNINKNSSNQHLTYTDLLVWAVACTLKKHKLINAAYQDESIRLFNEVHIGLASVTDKGLVVPVIRHADQLSLQDLAAKRSEIIERVRNGKQTPDDLSDGTFTITNLGMFGIEWFNPIISPGQSAILGVGKIINTPVADDAGRIYVAPMLRLILACDHRVADGANGAEFLSDLKVFLENPVD